MSKLCGHLWIEQNDKLKGDIIYCQRCDSLVSKEVFATINADAARIAELEAENTELSEALNVQNVSIVDLGSRNAELKADCKAMAGAIGAKVFTSCQTDIDTIAAKYRERLTAQEI